MSFSSRDGKQHATSGKSISDHAFFIFDRTRDGLFDIRRKRWFIVSQYITGRGAMGRLRTKRTNDQRRNIHPGPSGVAGYFYTKPPATIARDQTVTLIYSIEGSKRE